MNSDGVTDAFDRMQRREEARAEEAARIAAVKAQGFVPDDCGPDIPVAPARGPVRMFEPRAVYPKGADGYEVKPAGHDGRKALQRADVFDVMAAKAARHRKGPPFSKGPVVMARFYRDLVEKHACAGVKCSSIEAGRSGGGTGGDFMDAVLRDRDRIALLRRRIGGGSALVVRRHRPSKRGSRATIMDRRLVDMVCLEDLSLTDVLTAHGWAVNAKLRASLRVALGGALDRMMGPVGGGIGVVRFGDPGSPLWQSKVFG